MAKAILLDLDKTLVNAEDHVDYCAARDRARERLGALPRAIEMPQTNWGRCALEIMEILVAIAGTPQWSEVSSLVEDFEAAATDEATAMPGLSDFLAALTSRKKAVVTLCGPRSANRLCQRFGVAADAIVARAPEHRIKPAADQVLAALAALGEQAANAVMIGDSAWDQGAALAAGVSFVGLTNGKTDHEFGANAVVATDLAAAIDILLAS